MMTKKMTFVNIEGPSCPLRSGVAAVFVLPNLTIVGIAAMIYGLAAGVMTAPSRRQRHSSQTRSPAAFRALTSANTFEHDLA